MKKAEKRSRGKFVRRAGASVVLVAGVGSLLAFRSIFPHNGEKALNLVPSSAAFVGTLDLDPAPSQVLTFAKVWSGLQRNGFDKSLENLGKEIEKQQPGAEELWKLSKHSVSFCGFGSPNAKSLHGAVLIPITDPQKAQAWLATHGQSHTVDKTTYYGSQKGAPYAMLEGDTLVVSDDVSVLQEMSKVQSGELAPITQTPGYAEARAKAPNDATLLVLGTPNAAELTNGVLSKKSLGWFTVSATIQENGIQFQSEGKANPAEDHAIAEFASVKPLRSDLLSVLPSGAYSVFAQSQPGRTYFASIQSAIAHNDEAAKYIAEIQKNTGIDLQNDLTNGLKGDLVVATYPSKQPSAGLDFLLVADNQNGAEPGLLATKLQALLDKTVHSKNPEANDQWFEKLPRAEGEEFKLVPHLEQEMQTGKWLPSRSNVLLSDKTVAWANVAGTEFISSSQTLLDDAIAASQGKGSKLLSSDASLIGGLKQPSQDQTLTVANLSRIAEGLQNTVEDSKMDPTIQKVYNRCLAAAITLDKPLTCETSITPDGESKATAFVPVDYSKLIDAIAAVRDFEQGIVAPFGSPSQANFS